MQHRSRSGRGDTGGSHAVPLTTRSVEVSLMHEPAGGLRIGVSALGTTSTIGPEGEWDLAGKPAAAEAVATTLKQNPEHLVLDLSRLTFMDSSGVHARHPTLEALARRAVRLASRARIQSRLCASLSSVTSPESLPLTPPASG